MENKILIVEDDQFVSELYEHQFTKQGFNVKVAFDGEAALAASSSEKFDLVLLDMMIPKIDGLQVLKKLKEEPNTKDIPVIILSNLGQEDLIKEALEIGAKAYIVKSLYTPAQVVAEVRSTLGV